MKALIFLSLACLAYSFVNDSPAPTWIGKFQTILGCSDSCCCPVVNQTYYLAPIGNQTHIVGAFEDTPICSKLGLSSSKGTTTYPFGQSDAMSPGPTNGVDGQIFLNWFILANYPFVGPNGQVENITLATVQINQTSVGGDDGCFFRMQKTGLIDE